MSDSAHGLPKEEFFNIKIINLKIITKKYIHIYTKMIGYI